jgi:hypothetical protein
MKKILFSLLFISVATFQADAASKNKAKSKAYVDHSMDEAYSAKWAHKATSPAADADFTVGTGRSLRPWLGGRTMYYGLNNFTVYGTTAVNMNAPYQGGYAPSWDGPERNAARNIRANNESEPLPPNDGNNSRK